MQQDHSSANDSASFDSFEELFNESFKEGASVEGRVVRGRIVAFRGDMAIIDVGFKSEGKVSIKDIQTHSELKEPRVGDSLDVYLERLEDRNGETGLSVEKARREAVWTALQRACDEGVFVNGFIFGKVKGGFAVDLDGAVAFLPGSQVDLRPVRDVKPLVNVVQPFKILKMDRARNNIVVSRRSVLEESRAEARSELVGRLSEGQIIRGVVKNITDYGAFVDLGGIDGLLHVTDISWKRINHPSEALKMGDMVDVQILRFNKDTHRISLGMKQIGPDPWREAAQKYIPGERYKGKVVNIADYGAFIELDDGIEGLVYVAELSWTKRNIHPSKVLEIGQEVEVVALELDSEKRRLALGLKQCMQNPWLQFKEKYPVGSIIEGKVKSVTEFGIFIGVSEELDGMVHLSDVTWETDQDTAAQKYKPDHVIKVKILDVDSTRERISLGIKQVDEDPFEAGVANLKKGDAVTGKITQITDRGIEVMLGSGVLGIIRKGDLSRDRDYQRGDRFAVDEKVDAKVMMIDRSIRRVILSIKALEFDEEKVALSEYGSVDSGATLGSILGEAIRKSKQEV